ncbi:MAG: thioredoxin domain-containing protein [Polyangiales bacterium]
MDATFLSAGTRIDGRYELVSCLGVTMTGEVWRANDARLDMRPVAVKVLKTDFMTPPEVVSRFDAEVDALVHRVREVTPVVLDRGALGDLRYVVTELPVGDGLRALLDAAPSVPQTMAMDAFPPPGSSYGSQPGGFPPPTPYGAPPQNAFPPVGYAQTAAMPGFGPHAPTTASPWPQSPQPYPLRTPTAVSGGTGAFSALVIGVLFMGLLVASGAWFAMRTRRTTSRVYSTSAPLPSYGPMLPPPPTIPPPTRPAVRPPEDPDRIYVVREDPSAPSLGPRDAPVTVVTFSDFQCPFCARVNPTLERLREQYRAQVRIVWRNYPLAFHQNAMPAAEAAEEVLRQRGNDAFWRYHAMLFENQRALTTEDLVRYASAVGANGDHVRRALEDHRHQSAVRSDIAAFDASGARAGTPAFFINGRMLRGAQPYERFAAAVDRALREGVERR